MLDFGIHEDRAAGSQVAGRLGQDGFLGELGSGEAQRVGKGLDERAAARRTGFVQLDPVQDPVLDEHGFHVLTSDIEDEINFRAYLLGCRVMRQRFHHRQVQAESRLDQLFPVAGGAARNNRQVHAGRFLGFGELFQPVLHRANRVAHVLGIIREHDSAFLVHQHYLGCRAAGVDAQY